VQNALLATYTAEVQELEQAVWDVVRKRMAPYAEGVQLDYLGAIVGEARQGRSDDTYRVWIDARIAANSSLGRAPDVIAVLQIVDAGVFRWHEWPGGSVIVEYADTPDAAAITELGPIIGAARAAGTNVRVRYPAYSVDLPGRIFTFRYAADPNDAALGFAYPDAGSDGGCYSHSEQT